MTLNNTSSLIFLSAIFVFSSCKKSDSGPGAPSDLELSITSISPSSGPSATLATITGKGFTTLDSVFINGKGAAVVSTSATQLVVKVPPQAGTGTVSITAGGKSVTGPVFNFTGNTYVVSTFAGSGKASSADGTGTAASFKEPCDIAIDGHDNLYVVDGGNNKIRMITPTGAVTTFAGDGNATSVDAKGTLASFNLPNGIAVDSKNNNVYVAEFGGNRIRKITPDGTVSTIAGSASIGSADGIGTAASFYQPVDVAVDGSGNVFVSDLGNHAIRKITPTDVVSSFAGSGILGSADGKGIAASFNKLTEMNFDAAGNLYVADRGNNTIRKITQDGTATTIAGEAGIGGEVDGTGLSARFNGAYSVAIDANGFLYVSDYYSHVIRQITPEGVVTLLAGTVDSFGTDDGPAVNARFYFPEGVAIDSHGNIFVADQNNNTIRKLTPQ